MKSLKDFINESKENYVNAFVKLKPEFLEYEDKWLKMLDEDEWDILDKKKLTLTKEQAEQLYMMHKGKDFYDDLVEYMSSGECLCAKCYKECEDPIEEMGSLKDKVRDKWGKNDMKNAMHSSDSIENVKRESKIVFE